jgi:hypothetical protein
VGELLGRRGRMLWVVRWAFLGQRGTVTSATVMAGTVSAPRVRFALSLSPS